MRGRTAPRDRSFLAKVFVVALFALVLASCSDKEKSASGGSQREGYPAPEVTSLKIAIPALEPSVFLPQLAADAGFYEKYGLTDVETVYFEGSQKTLQAIIAGQVEVANDAPQITLTSMLTEDPLVDVAVFNNKFLDCIVAKGDIKGPEDMLEKRVAVSGLGVQSHAEVIVALTELEVSPADVEITVVGGQDSRIAALEAGSVDVIPVDCVLEEELKSQGYNVLLRLPEVDTQLVGSSLQLKREFIRENPNTVLALVAANLEAMNLLFEDTQGVAGYFAEWAQIEEEDALTALENYKNVAQRDLRWIPEGYQNVQDVLAETNAAAAAVDIKEAYNPEFLDKLEELGLYEELGL